MSTPTRPNRLASFVIAAWFGAQAASCARGDIVLGERGGLVGSAWTGSAGEGAAGSAGDAGDAVPVGQAGVAAVGGATAGSGGASGMVERAGTPAGANASGSVATTDPPRTVARPSSGCGKDPASADSSFEIYGMRERYVVAPPMAYDRTRAYPLVIAFHSIGMTVEEFSQALNLAAVAGDEAIVLYPNPLTETAAWEFTRDMPMFDVLLPKVKADYCIDEDRVFALGDGSGALFTNLVGCVNADEVRAIALLSGAPPPPGPCTGNTAVWLAQSTRDTSSFGASKGNRDFWASRNKCDIRMSISAMPEPCVEYAGCASRTPVRYCEHDEDGLPSFVVSAAWDFFKSL